MGKGARGAARNEGRLGAADTPQHPSLRLEKPLSWAQLLFPGPGRRETIGGDRRGRGSAAHLPLTCVGEAERGQGAESGQQKDVHGEAGMLRAALSPWDARRPLYTRPSRPWQPKGRVTTASAPAPGGVAGKLPGSGPGEAGKDGGSAKRVWADASGVWRSSEHFGGCREWSPLQGEM